MTDKHDAGCRRRKAEWDFPYLCTCDLTDADVHNALGELSPIRQTAAMAQPSSSEPRTRPSQTGKDNG